MYAASTASTTSGSGVVLCSGEKNDRRVRVVRLLRPRRTAFGFSLRGGREHGTGFFISKVEINSEAHHQGLKAGDHVVSVNGYRVDDAVHSELAHYLNTQTRLKIKVRNVGMIPVKDKQHEPLSWLFVSERESLCSGVSSSPTLCHDTPRHQDLHLSILVPPRAKLGCGICKGPEWKPGIFVQFVRENSIAKEAGLRPGDQILACNGQDFANISFNEAILAMKATGRLELLVREGAGAELVSPESSGYNSSASSAAGERSPAPPPTAHAPLAPPAALRRRLASVAEEAADRADRLTINKLKRRTWDSLDFEWKNIHNFDIPSDIEPDYDNPSIPNNPHTYDNQIKDLMKKEFITNPSNRTIINLTENGATIQCNYDNQSPRKTTYSASQSTKEDKKTIVVEVHHTSCPQNGSAQYNNLKITKTKDLSDSGSLSSSTTLSSAIAEEILRRKMKKKVLNTINGTPENTIKKANITVNVDNDKKKQHDALMDEFKKVHRKMFAAQDGTAVVGTKEDNEEITDMDRQVTLPLRKPIHSGTTFVADGKNIPVKNNITEQPPPPPPMPIANGFSVNDEIKLSNQKNSIKDTIDLIKDSNSKNGIVERIPTADYNKKNVVPIASKLKTSTKEEAELESLQSFKLKNPSAVQPKPPSTYFISDANGTKKSRPVSVTIGEYASNGVRKEPSKLNFLSSEKNNGIDKTDDVSISNRLQSELALTLSRSNLRKKTELVDGDR